MREELNPYTPGSGLPPIVLAGRDDDIEAFQALVARANLGLPPARPLVLAGLRGVGKTVLLNRMREIAEDAEWITVKWEVQTGRRREGNSRRALLTGLVSESKRLGRVFGAKRLKSILAGVASLQVTLGQEGLGLAVEADPSRASSGALEIDLADVLLDLAAEMKSKEKGIALFIDEMQDLDEELLDALVAVQHEAGQRGLPFYVIGAGLPGLPALLAGSRSYAERMFNYRRIDRLDRAAAAAAFEEPARKVEGAFAPDALELLVTESGQYPYFIQEFGASMWQIAERSPFSVSDARVAAVHGIARLDAGFFPSRWERATPAERDYLTAMAEDGEGPSVSSKVAERLGKPPSSLGPTRANLIAKGLVYAPEHGRIAFTVPSFHQYIRRRSDLEGR